jgi:hypothetical protein
MEDISSDRSRFLNGLWDFERIDSNEDLVLASTNVRDSAGGIGMDVRLAITVFGLSETFRILTRFVQPKGALSRSMQTQMSHSADCVEK